MLIRQIEPPGIVHGFRGFEWQLAYGLLRVETRCVLAWQVLLKHLEVLSGKWILVMVAANQSLRLQLMNQRVGACEMPVRVRLVPHSVKPDAADLSIIRKQLAQL